jgi:hypothetical protein
MKNKISIACIIIGTILIGAYWLNNFNQSNHSDVKKSSFIETEKKSNSLIFLGQYKISSGTLFVYKLGNDTIYLIEGKTSSYPVSLHVK